MKNSYLWILLRGLSRIFFYCLYTANIKLYSIKGIEFIIISPGKTGSSSLQVHLSENRRKSFQLHRLSAVGIRKSIEKDIQLYKGISKHLYVSWCIQKQLNDYRGIYLMPFRSVLSRDLSSCFQNSSGFSFLYSISTNEGMDRFLEKRYYQNSVWLDDLIEWIEEEIYDGFRITSGEFPTKEEIVQIEVVNNCSRLICFDVKRTDDVLRSLGIKHRGAHSNIGDNKYYSRAYKRAKERIDKDRVLYSCKDGIVEKWI